jgi:hypothetical protein
MKKEEISLVLETCSSFINEPDDLQSELSTLGNTAEWEANCQHGISNHFNNTMADNNSFFNKRNSSVRNNPDICKVIQLLWSNPAVRSMVKDAEQEV